MIEFTVAEASLVRTLLLQHASKARRQESRAREAAVYHDLAGHGTRGSERLAARWRAAEETAMSALEKMR